MDWFASKKVAPYVFMAPVLLFGLIFFLIPLGFSAYISLTEWDSAGPPRWVGLANYAHLLGHDPFLLSSLLNTFYFAFGMIALGVPSALILAYVISRSRFSGVWRAIFWLPQQSSARLGAIESACSRIVDSLAGRALLVHP